jgi:hypothetical protein
MSGVPSIRTLQCPRGVTRRPLGRKHIAILLKISLALSAWKAAGAARWPLRYPAAGLRPTRHG